MSEKNKFGVLLCTLIIGLSVCCFLVSEAGGMTESAELLSAYAVGGCLPSAIGGLLLFAIFRSKSTPDAETGW